MPSVKLSPSLKKVISQMPAREKDKLLFRLVAKDAALVERLEFQLLEKGATTDDRREDLREEIDQSLEKGVRYYHSPGYLLMDVRSLSGLINAHVKTTRDKFGEVDLNFFLLNKTLSLHRDHLRTANPYHARTFNEYVVKRALKLLRLLNTLHVDYHLEFKDPMRALADHFGSLPHLMKTAIQHGLDVNWFLRGEVPDPEELP